MRFALLGVDSQVMPLVQAVVSTGHELVWIGEPAGWESALRPLAPAATWDEPWEALLDRRTADVVLAGSGGDEEVRADRLRRLVQAGAPLLAVHPISQSTLLYYELDMLRRESKSVLRSYVAGRFHPALVSMGEMVRAGENCELGAIEQVVFGRAMPHRTKESVLEQFARDVMLIADVCGELDQIGVLGVPDEATAYSSLGVQMSGPAGIVVRWSATPVDAVAGGRLVLVGNQGQAALHIPEADEPWSLELTRDGQMMRHTVAQWDSAAEAIRQVAQAAEQGRTDDEWIAFLRAMDLAEAAERSLRKGRTISVRYEEPSEMVAFKGTMATVGCGLLMVGFAVMLLAGVIGFFGQAVGVPIRFVRIWPVALFAVLAVFLLLQLLPKLVLAGERKPPDRPKSD